MPNQKTVLDASALLAWLHEEPGAKIVDDLLNEALISSVNWAEVFQKALAHDLETKNLRQDLESLGVCIVPFSARQAEIAAELWRFTRSAGLSLGDRACLALTSELRCPVLTTDKVWNELNLDIKIRVIR